MQDDAAPVIAGRVRAEQILVEQVGYPTERTIVRKRGERSIQGVAFKKHPDNGFNADFVLIQFDDIVVVGDKAILDRPSITNDNEGTEKSGACDNNGETDFLGISGYHGKCGPRMA